MRDMLKYSTDDYVTDEDKINHFISLHEHAL